MRRQACLCDQSHTPGSLLVASHPKYTDLCHVLRYVAADAADQHRPRATRAGCALATILQRR